MAPWLDEYLQEHVERRVQALVKQQLQKEMPLIYTTMSQLNKIANRDGKQIGEIAASSDDVKQMVLNVVTAQSGRIFLYSNNHVYKQHIQALNAQIITLNARIEELHMNFVLRSDLFHPRNKCITPSR